MPKLQSNNWSREELIVALYWYCTKVAFSKIRYTKKEVIELSNLVKRTPSAAAFKLVNFARLDPILQDRGIKGMTKGSKAEIPIWNEFYNNWDNLAIMATEIIAGWQNKPIEEVSDIQTADLDFSGKERLATIKARINQKFFRNSVLVSYDNSCCITKIKIPELLVASHIKPWASDLSQAANPENGLCLNALHDKAFDKGLITLTTDLKIQLSREILDKKKELVIQKYFLPYHKMEIIKPGRFFPNLDFIKFHNEYIFLR